MKLFSKRTALEVLSGILINLTSAWFGILVVTPGFFDVSSVQEYLQLLIVNLPFAIVGLVVTLLVSEEAKRT